MAVLAQRITLSPQSLYRDAKILHQAQIPDRDGVTLHAADDMSVRFLRADYRFMRESAAGTGEKATTGLGDGASEIATPRNDLTRRRVGRTHHPNPELITRLRVAAHASSLSRRR